MARRYEFNPKHATEYGNVSRMDLSDAEATRLLNGDTCFTAKSNALVAVCNRTRIYAFRMHNPNTYHGYPISGTEVCRTFPEVQADVARAMGISVKRLSRLR